MELKGRNDSQMVFIRSALADMHGAVDAWITWYIDSQGSSNLLGETPESFRWRGRSTSDQKVIPNTLASGLDDYPRSFIPSDDESHVDLHSWIVSSCRIMTQLESFILTEKKKFGL